jgi:hypothetical protein
LAISSAGKSRKRHHRLIGAWTAAPVGVPVVLEALGGFAPLRRSEGPGMRGDGPAEEEPMLRTSRPCRRKHDVRPSLEPGWVKYDRRNAAAHDIPSSAPHRVDSTAWRAHQVCLVSCPMRWKDDDFSCSRVRRRLRWEKQRGRRKRGRTGAGARRAAVVRVPDRRLAAWRSAIADTARLVCFAACCVRRRRSGLCRARLVGQSRCGASRSRVGRSVRPAEIPTNLSARRLAGQPRVFRARIA